VTVKLSFRASISFQIPEPAIRVADYVALAEQEGFDGIAWLSDSHLIWRDVYVSMAVALQKTRSIRLGPGVTNPVTRDPTVTAAAIATLDELSPGRVVLGIGAGDSAVYTMHKNPASLKELKGTIQVIRGLLQGDEVTINGQTIRLTWTKRRIPIYLASTGPRSLRMAGELADGVIINVGALPSLINWALEHLNEGVRRSGRTIGDLDIWVRVHCYPDEDEARAKEIVRVVAATKANGLARYARDDSFRRHLTKNLLDDIDRIAKEYDYYEHGSPGARHSGLVSGRIVESLAVAGTSSYCITRLRELMNTTGLNQFMVHTSGFPDIPAFVRKFAREIAVPLR
jgi:alkanesulfonate monooxygenase SsuD/methylene tetrahydromethanopterin reductase-like flavin-dependent oxidoreductase (luciferase family)